MSNEANEAWEVIEQASILERPCVPGSLGQIPLPAGEDIPDWSAIPTPDYTHAVVVNNQGEALILEEYKHGSGWSSWQVPGGYLQEGEDPLSAVQRVLLEKAGCHSPEWVYLGTYVMDATQNLRVGHFFLARQTTQAVDAFTAATDPTLRWVPVPMLKTAILDGRIAVMSHAMAIAMAFLTVLK